MDWERIAEIAVAILIAEAIAGVTRWLIMRPQLDGSE